MRGTMLWFNEEKGYGFISTEEGERLLVNGSGFAGGRNPEGRCAGLSVTFELSEVEGVRQAQECVLVEEAPGRRARLRHGGSRRRL